MSFELVKTSARKNLLKFTTEKGEIIMSFNTNITSHLI